MAERSQSRASERKSLESGSLDSGTAIALSLDMMTMTNMKRGTMVRTIDLASMGGLSLTGRVVRTYTDEDGRAIVRIRTNSRTHDMTLDMIAEVLA